MKRVRPIIYQMYDHLPGILQHTGYMQTVYDNTHGPNNLWVKRLAFSLRQGLFYIGWEAHPEVWTT